jgi:DNA-binding Xre family transcriptional regulator
MPEQKKPELAAAPEAVQYKIEHTEALEFENLTLKINSLQMQTQSLQEAQYQVVSAICKRLGRKPEDILNINPQTWMISFKKEDAKGKKKQARVLPMPPKR